MVDDSFTLWVNFNNLVIISHLVHTKLVLFLEVLNTYIFSVSCRVDKKIDTKIRNTKQYAVQCGRAGINSDRADQSNPLDMAIGETKPV